MIRAQLASLPERVASLRQTIESLLPQVNFIQVVLNGYKEPPPFSHRKVNFVIMNNEYGDAGKFYNIEDYSGYFFSCDDDLIYPPDYVERMKVVIDRSHCIATMHGKIFDNRPINSYHHGFTFAYRCLGAVDSSIYVDVCGSGVSAFHTDDFKLKLTDFQKPNMADLWMSKAAHEQGVKMLCLAHPVGYFGYNHYDANIYDQNHRNESFQTELLNSFLK